MNLTFLNNKVFGNTLLEYLVFIIIMLLGIFLKNLISKLILFILNKTFKDITHNERNIFEVYLLKPLAFLILLCTTYIAINVLNFPLDVVLFKNKEIINNQTAFRSVTLGFIIDQIFLFLIVLSIFKVILRVIDFIAHILIQKAIISHEKRKEQLVSFVKEFSKAMMVIIAFFVVLSVVFKVNVLTLITGLGIGGIAFALAAKESLENLLGSFTIFLDKPFVVGDFIKVDGIEGVVEKVGFRSTWIRSADKSLLVLPNRNMIDGILENYTERTYRRVKFNVGLVYETENESIKKIITRIRALLAAHPAILDGYTVNFEIFSGSSLDVAVIYLCKELDYNAFMDVRQEINLDIISIVAEEGSSFAYPTQRSIEERIENNG